MALVPCNVCGTLNSDGAEICLSCEYPIKGSRRPQLFKWAALLLFVLFMTPLINIVINNIRANNQPKRSVSPTQIAPNNQALKSSSIEPIWDRIELG